MQKDAPLLQWRGEDLLKVVLPFDHAKRDRLSSRSAAVAKS
jgi:hypothetical protein